MRALPATIAAMHGHVFPHIAKTTILCAAILSSYWMSGQTPAPSSAQKPATPEWAQPGSATHSQVAPPSDFHRPTTTFNTPIGIFDGQSDVGSAVLPGSATFDATTGAYTV